MNTILHQERYRQLGARFFERDGWTLPRDYGDARAEYRALRASAGIIDLSNFGVLRVEGRDRVTWLHKLITSNVEGLSAGTGTYALLLNATGHVVADFVLLLYNDAVLLYTSWDAKEKLFANLRRAIFRDKVSLSDASNDFTVLSLQGPRSNDVIAKISETLPVGTPFTFVGCKSDGIEFTLVRNSRIGSDGLDLLVPRAHAAALWDALIERGARPVGFDALNVARVEAGIPWFGDDFDETTLAPEARLEKFIAEDKGCYTGQEVIARIKNRGHVNRLLAQLQVEGQVVPERGDKIYSDSREVGWITSAVWSFEHNVPHAFGYLRRELAQDGTHVQIARAGSSGAPPQTAIVRMA